MNAETLNYLREAGPFTVGDASPVTWEVLAANNDILAVCDDEDVANYIRESMNAARPPRDESGSRTPPPESGGQPKTKGKRK